MKRRVDFNNNKNKARTNDEDYARKSYTILTGRIFGWDGIIIQT